MKLRILYRLIQLIGKETIIDEMIPEDMYESIINNIEENNTLRKDDKYDFTMKCSVYDSDDFIKIVHEYTIARTDIILEKYVCKKYFHFNLPKEE